MNDLDELLRGITADNRHGEFPSEESVMDDYFMECDLARAICRGNEKYWPTYMEEARSIIASVRKAGYEITRPKRRNARRTEHAATAIGSKRA